jgi:uncharacterized Zn finger protein (UPF0148 family)
MADLARCPRCGSVHLVRRLGEVECRDCGAVVPPSPGPGEGEALAETALAETARAETARAETARAETVGGAAGPSPDLSEEVARALDRVLGRGLVSQSAPRTGAETR